jgi:hypothetical protein
MRNAYNILIGKLKGRDHSEDLGLDGRINIRLAFRQIGWEGVDWFHLAQGSV